MVVWIQHVFVIHNFYNIQNIQYYNWMIHSNVSMLSLASRNSCHLGSDSQVDAARLWQGSNALSQSEILCLASLIKYWTVPFRWVNVDNTFIIYLHIPQQNNVMTWVLLASCFRLPDQETKLVTLSRQLLHSVPVSQESTLSMLHVITSRNIIVYYYQIKPSNFVRLNHFRYSDACICRWSVHGSCWKKS